MMLWKYFKLIASYSLLVLILIGLAACSKPATNVASSDVDYWTCTMHPSVHSKTPGKCPICSMDLVPVMKKKTGTADTSAASEQRDSRTASDQPMGGMQMASEQMPGRAKNIEQSKTSEFTVPVERQQQIGVTYAEVRRRPLWLDIRSVGTLQADQTQMFEYVARVDGYIQELKVSSPGERVAAGKPLMTIYSPDLRSSEQELVNLLKVQENGSGARASLDALIDSARRRLRLWNVDPKEIAELEHTRQPSDQLVLRSPFDGVVDSAPMKAGMSVKSGDKLISMLNLSRLWLWAEFYENEVSLLQEGQPMQVTLTAFPNRSFEGKISVISPAIDPVKRTAMIRIDIPNPGGRLRPGMYANVVAQVNAGEGLTIPFDSVLPTGSRMLVFVNKGSGRLEPRFIQVDRDFVNQTDQNRYYQVVNGLREGERVVSSANFLIDAESQVQGAIKDWNQPEESNPETLGMDDGSSPTKAATLQKVAPKLYLNLMQAYSAIQNELAKDSMKNVQDSGTELLRQLQAIHKQLLDHVPDPTAYDEALDRLYVLVQNFHPSNLDDARVQFGNISEQLIALLSLLPEPLNQSWHVVECPMWKKSPARWLQSDSQITNPFMGQAMATCGEVVGELPKVN
jgi:RND family efflux transporter MFP subunit